MVCVVQREFDGDASQISVQTQVLLPRLQLEVSRFQIQAVQLVVLALLDIVHQKHRTLPANKQSSASLHATSAPPPRLERKESSADARASRDRPAAKLLDEQAADAELPFRGVPPSAFHLRINNASITLLDTVGCRAMDARLMRVAAASVAEHGCLCDEAGPDQSGGAALFRRHAQCCAPVPFTSPLSLLQGPPVTDAKRAYAQELDAWLQLVLGLARRDTNLRQNATSIAVQSLDLIAEPKRANRHDYLQRNASVTRCQ